MTKHCFYKDCSSRTPGVKFITFVKPTTDLKRCQRWINLCGRDIETFKISKVSLCNRYVKVKKYIKSLFANFINKFLKICLRPFHVLKTVCID